MAQWKAVVERKAHRGNISKVMGNEQFILGMWENFTLNRLKCLQRDAGASQRERRHGMRFPNDAARLPCNEGRQMGRVQRKTQGKKKSHRNGLSKEYAKRARRWQWMKSVAWALRRKSREKHGLLAADHRADRWNGRCYFVIFPALQRFPLEDYIWWVSTGHGDNRMKKHCSWWCEVCGGILVVQLGTDANEAKVFRAHAVLRGLCRHLIRALKLLANSRRAVTAQCRA